MTQRIVILGGGTGGTIMATTTIAGTTADVDAEGFLTDSGQRNEQVAAEIARENGVDVHTLAAGGQIFT